MIDRINGPQIKEVSVSEFPLHKKIQLENGMDLYVLNAGTQNIFKLEVIYNGGRRYESKSAVGRMCASILRESIKGKNSEELSEYWDYYGAIINSFSDLDTSGAILTSLNKHSQELLPTFISMLNNPIFPSEEIENKKKIFAEKLKRELSKNDVIGYRELTSIIYGSDHYYGYNTEPEDYQDIKRDDLIDHFEKYWGANRGFAILSGKISLSLEKEVVKHLGTLRQAKTIYKSEELVPIQSLLKQGNFNFPTANKMQAALKLGTVTIHRNNPDYTYLYLLIQILGGYFGSRLMKNLREEKGLCYNIYASIDRLKTSNYLYISAEVDSDKVEESLKEINKEIHRLKEELVSDEELQMVKNYINGKILAGLDGPFRSSQLIKSYVSSELSFDNFAEFNSKLSKASAKILRDVARKYLDTDQMVKVIVGP